MAMSVGETFVEYKGTSGNKPDSRSRDKVIGGGDCNKFHFPSGSKPSEALGKAKVESSGGDHKTHVQWRAHDS